jgi:hypothetical protein
MGLYNHSLFRKLPASKLCTVRGGERSGRLVGYSSIIGVAAAKGASAETGTGGFGRKGQDIADQSAYPTQYILNCCNQALAQLCGSIALLRFSNNNPVATRPYDVSQWLL